MERRIDAPLFFLSNDDAGNLLTTRECIDALEQAYVELAEGRGVSRTRSACPT